MTQTRYSLSFSTGGSFLAESGKFVELYLQKRSWDTVKEEALSQNVLQIRMVSSARRISREIIQRLSTLSYEELTFLRDCSNEDFGYLIWIAICRRYEFIRDFALEVLQVRFALLKQDLLYKHFDEFVEQKAFWHPELQEVTPSTMKKLRQVVFRMMRESGLLSKRNQIVQAIPSRELVDLISGGNYQDLMCLPLLESYMKRGL